MTLRILNRRCDPPLGTPADDVLRLPFETRQKSRFRARLTDGREVGVMLARGGILRDGHHLCADGDDEPGAGPDGEPEVGVVRVEAAPEPVSEVHSTDALLLMRASYHLGNRHVPLELGPGWVRYGHDGVLDAMLEGLGLPVRFTHAPFEPEAGAYAGGAHHHGLPSEGSPTARLESGTDAAPESEHEHGHGHGHGHEHGHGHGHGHGH